MVVPWSILAEVFSGAGDVGINPMVQQIQIRGGLFDVQALCLFNSVD